jgi:hypothetical protein
VIGAPSRSLALSVAWLGGVVACGCGRTTGGPAPQAEALVDAGAPAAIGSVASKAEPDAAPAAALLREALDVTVDGTVEHWRLEWAGPPKPACRDESWFSCICAGFAFGEKGDLSLVREHPGQEPDRLDLTKQFALESEEHAAVVARWPVTEDDRKSETPPNDANLTARKAVQVMDLADYDHDGRATELILQVGAGPCGHQPSVVVGISRTVPTLHAFTTVEAPDKPLVLARPLDWTRVALHVPATLVEIGCGDHGARVEEDAVVRVDAKGLHMSQQKLGCDPSR